MHLQTSQKILLLFCSWIICQCIATIILSHLEVLWNYYRDEVKDAAYDSDAANSEINNNKTVTNKSFVFKTKQNESTLNDNNTLDTSYSSIDIFE